MALSSQTCSVGARKGPQGSGDGGQLHQDPRGQGGAWVGVGELAGTERNTQPSQSSPSCFLVTENQSTGHSDPRGQPRQTEGAWKTGDHRGSMRRKARTWEKLHVIGDQEVLGV